MAAKRPEVVKLSGPGDLVAAVPHLFGFVPTESIVLLGLHGPRKRINLSLRLDLCPPEHDAVIAAELARRLGHSGSDAVQIVLMTAADDGSGLPRRDLVEQLSRALWVPVIDALLVRAGRWWSYRCDDDRCCPAAGTPVDLHSGGATAMAAAHAMLGRSVLPDREAVVRTVAAPRGIAAVAADQALERVVERFVGVAGSEWKPAVLALVGDLIGRYADPRISVRADDAALISLACHDVVTRDAILALDLDDDGQEQLRRLMQDCVRRALPPIDAPVCATFAWLAYAGGDAVLASAAVERALASDPDLSLARLILDAINQQVHPRLLRAAARPPRNRPAGQPKRPGPRGS
jgi:hypothetical protein